MRVLALDIEGGFGGSSRSLYEMVRHVPVSEAKVEVWCAKAGPIQDRYRAESVPVKVMPEMPRYSALPRMSRNLFAIARYGVDWLWADTFRQALLKQARSVDLVHFNHEALWLLAHWLAVQLPERAQSMHIRTNLHDSIFARMQCRCSSAAVDDLIFITENERDTFNCHAGSEGGAGRARQSVIYNSVELPLIEPQPWPGLQRKPGEFRVACLSNYAWIRGVDRLLDVAEALRELGRSDIVFVLAGHMALPGSLPGELGEIGRRGGSLEDAVAARGLTSWFRFLGHVSAPERVLAACDALIKPTRENNPWGRDIIEALAMGRPAISVGHYDRLVENGVTGILQPTFDAIALAGHLAAWADQPSQAAAMGIAGRERVAVLCNGKDRAADLVKVWRVAVNEHAR